MTKDNVGYGVRITSWTRKLCPMRLSIDENWQLFALDRSIVMIFLPKSHDRMLGP